MSSLFSKDGLIHGRKAIPADDPLQAGADPTRKLDIEKLETMYLCKRKHSDCARTGKCEQLAYCRYGQKYLELKRKAGE